MKMFSGRGIILLCTAIFLSMFFGGLQFAHGSPETDAKVIEWGEKVVLGESFTVSRGEKLVVLPGTEIVVKPGNKVAVNVFGNIEIKGKEEKPVRFNPEGDTVPGAWMGIRINDSRENTIQHCSIMGASSGVSLVNASVSLSASSFENCRKGIEINQKSLAKVEGCSFGKNLIGIVASLSGRVEVSSSKFDSIREVGLIVENGGTGLIEGCDVRNGKKGLFLLTNAPVSVLSTTFAHLEQGAIYRQVGKNSSLKRCTFEKNSTGILSVQFSFQVISDCTFKNNKMALDIREFSSPHVTHCRIVSNEVGVNLFRKSNSLIDFNVLLNNRTAVVIDFSSYPGIFSNNFERNDMHIKLGNFQSGDWEKRAGSKNIAGREAAQRGSRNIAVFKGEQSYPEKINARGNFWGTDLGTFETGEMNLEKIWDGRDFGPLSYEGYGDEKYRIDLVDYSEWKSEPVKEAGLRGAVKR